MNVPSVSSPANPLEVSARPFNLSPGYYGLVVTNAGGEVVHDGVPLPSAQLRLPPYFPAGTTVKTLGGRSGGWLTNRGETLTIEVTGGNAALTLLFYTHASNPSAKLTVRLVRIDDEVGTGSAVAGPGAVIPGAPPSGGFPFPPRV
jgi:hypothetical protein